jgi:CHAT domain-containing protein
MNIDEQRIKKYLNLIQMMLSCPDTQQAEVLATQSDLLDAGLIEMMGQYADFMESRGDRNAALLRQILIQLGQKIGLPLAVQIQNSTEAESFAEEAMQLIMQTQGDRVQVYDFLQVNVRQLDEALLLALPKIFYSLGQKYDSSLAATTFARFGNLINQFRLGRRKLNLEIGIVCYELALQVRTCEALPVQWAMTLNNLANAYTIRIQGDRADNLEHAIASYQQVLTVYTKDAFPVDWAMTQNNLATAYDKRIRGNRADNLEMAIEPYKLALQVRTRNEFPVDWAMTQNNLAAAYSDRIRENRAENLEQSIIHYQQALQVRTRDEFPIQWAMIQSNLANTYNSRIRGERAENLEQAIIFYELALQIHTQNLFPEQWAITQNNLANTYKDRIRGSRANNLERAVECYKLALQIYTYNSFPEQWATILNNLSNAYLYRIVGERSNNLESAINSSELALQVRTYASFPAQWAGTHNNLALAYLYRIQGSRAENLKQSIDSYELALQVYTHETFPEQWAMTHNNLANAYYEIIIEECADDFRQLFMQANIEKAIASYQQALQVYTCETFPKDCRGVAQNLGNLHFHRESWTNAADAYKLALYTAEVLYQSSISLNGKGDELKATADIPRLLAYTYTQLSDVQAALLTLEQGRARGLNETLSRDRANLTELQQLAPNLHTQYQDITNQLRNLESQQRDRMVSDDRHSLTPEILRTTATKLRTDLEETIAQIRQVPGYETFLTPTQWEDIQSALTPDNPLIYLVTTTHGSLALIATSDQIEVLWPELTEPKLTELLNTYLTAYNQSSDDRQTWLDTIDSTTQNLWDGFMAPIVHHLETHGYNRATLVPTGTLSLLPLHAAWTLDENKPTGRRYALDTIHFTYTPNAKSLTVARSIANQVHTDSILAIGNPTQDLDISKQEIQAAIATFPQFTVLSQKEATVEAVRSNLGKAAIVHFSCHGTANFQEPLNSGLALSDGLLTLRDLFALNLPDQNGLRLAVLSACETGLPGLENIDEVVSLPIGLLQAGVAGVVSSLWSVDEVSTMMLLTRFYELWRKDGLEPAIALQQAQRWIRDTTSQQKAHYFKPTNPNLFQILILRSPNDFAHPFHWSAFNYTGV